MSHYGTLSEANAFFASRLHSFDWDNATVADRTKAMTQATELIDQFDYQGQKYAVQAYLDSIEAVETTTDEDEIEGMRQADLTQALQFPRGSVDEVPVEIERACYLIAKALLSGRDPEADLEGLALKSTGYGDVKSSYNRDGNLQEHVTHMIPSPQAWNLLKPFLRLRDSFKIKRV